MSADLRVIECTKPIDSVHIVTTRIRAKLRTSVLKELEVGRIAMTPVNTAGSAHSAKTGEGQPHQMCACRKRRQSSKATNYDDAE